MNSDEKKSLQSAYQSMMYSAAWLDLERYASDERDASIKRVDDKNASDLNLGSVCEERGIRKGIFKIIKYAQQRGEGV